MSSIQDSRFLSKPQMKSINKIGQSMLPGADDLPSFSQLGCVNEVDRILEHTSASDLKDLKLLLTIFSFLPTIVVGFLIRMIEALALLPKPFGGPFRLVRFAIRGLIMSLYYGHDQIHSKIEFEVGVYLEDQS